MKVTVAGEKKEIEQGTTIAKLIVDEKVENPEYVTVTVNDEFVESDDFETMSGKEFCRKMMADAERIDNDFGRIMVWRDMFYDYLMHAENRRYQASWELLRRLAHEYAKDSKVIELQKWMEAKPWEFIKTEFKRNDSRMLIKRYLSTLYNIGLRKEVFGF